jgi:hypothetical protein
MLVIGSAALAVAGIGDHPPNDLDVIIWKEELTDVVKQCGPKRVEVLSERSVILHECQSTLSPLLKVKHPIVELEIAWPGSSAEAILLSHKMDEYSGFWIFMKPVDVYWLKMSHRYKKNTPHFEKTRNDILRLRKEIGFLEYYKPHWYAQREKETYDYSHPNLSAGQSKERFFNGDGVKYWYDHDWIHTVVASMYGAEVPAYSLYLKEGEAVACDRSKFEALPHSEKLRGVMEEATVLALERSIIPARRDPEWKERNVNPNPEAIWKYALQKVCTSITSGWFREFAWENYDECLEKSCKNYANHFWASCP